MARNTTKNLKAASRFMFANRFGFQREIGTQGTGAVGPTNVDHDFDNGKPLTWSDAADLNSLSALGVDSDNRVQLDNQAQLGCKTSYIFNLAANSALGTQSFMIVDSPVTITGVSYVHSTLGTDAGAVTAIITHDTGVQAPGTGTSVQVGSFNCKGTINVVQNAVLASPNGDGSPAAAITLAAGDRLAIKFTGTLTALAGVVVTIYGTPGNKEEQAVYSMNANGSLATQFFFMANRDMVVKNANMIWSAAATNGGAVTIDITKDTGTAAAGAGTSILAAAISAKTAANTVNAAPLAASAATLLLAAGDRLAVKFTGTLTALAGVVVVVELISVGATQYYGEVNPAFALLANGSQATQAFFIADRDYELVDVSAIWGTANAGGTWSVTIDKGTTAPGGGTVVAPAIATTTTANTTSIGVLDVKRRNRMLSVGDRLSVVPATVGALAGLAVTASLLPR